MQRGEIQYAEADGHHIAFREIIGDETGGHDIVMVSGAHFPMDSLTEDPIAHRLLDGLANLGRLIVFDRRGIALSDPITDWETPLYEQWADDLAAVIRAAGCEKPVVFSWHVNAVARCCSVRHPDLVGELILFNPAAPLIDSDAEWIAELGQQIERLISGDVVDREDLANPGRSRDPDFRAWDDHAGRLGASPSQARRLTEKGMTDPPFDNTSVTVPTLVITRSPSDWIVPQEFFWRAADLIPGAHHVRLGSGDQWAVGLGVDDLLAEISEHLTGEVRIPSPDRRISAILFTDLVDSTRLAADSGDSEWKRVLDRHDRLTRREVALRGGEVVKMTGDGVLALLPSATGAVEAAHRLRDQLADEALDVRIGIHVGEVDRRAGDVSGLAINTAARVMSTAAARQILVTQIVIALAGELTFTSIGEVSLKGIDGTSELFIPAPDASESVPAW